MKLKKRWVIPAVIIFLLGLLSIPEIIHQNSGASESLGSVRHGKLKNGWLVPFHGNNFQYFSRFSYYILNCGYVNDRVYQTIIEAYHACESTCAEQKFWLMECTRKHGGRMLLHWTHQNGTSVDFMVPTKRGQKRDVLSDHIGLFHYLLPFNERGQFKLSPKTEIDFVTMGIHILALDDACRKNGLRIRKILFNTNMLDELLNTPAGREIQERDIFIPRRLNDFINKYHDDHYHVDFEIIGG
jgi:penicillin-insensitive murein endopeptidase